MNYIIIFQLLIFSSLVHAYPDFIGNGYTVCMTCHYNGAGNGPLNDYGRSLWAAEIAAKPFWNTSIENETLSEYSGLMGKVEFPYWLRLSLKFRGLTNTNNPGKPTETKKYHVMQREMSGIISFDEEQKYVVVLNGGMVNSAAEASPNKPFEGTKIITREHYFRWQISDTLWSYLGFMDKTYGIRHPDHTSVNRAFINVGQNDQTHGAVLQYFEDKTEFFINPYIGNLLLERKDQFSGLALLYLYEPSEKKRLGVTALTEENETIKRSRGGFIFESGVGDGSALLMEAGLIDNQTLGEKSKKGAYAWAQATMKLERGIYFQSIGQYFKQDISGVNPESFRWGLGFIYFPLQRIEFRAQLVQSRIIPVDQVEADTWSAQTQLHLSL